MDRNIFIYLSLVRLKSPNFIWAFSKPLMDDIMSKIIDPASMQPQQRSKFNYGEKVELNAIAHELLGISN